MAKKTFSGLFSAILYIALGIILVIFRAETIDWAMTIAGVVFIITGILELIKKEWIGGAVSLIIGVLIIVLGHLITWVVLLVLGILVAVKGLVSLIEEFKRRKKSVLGITFAILTILAGIALAFGNALDILILICGIVFIVDGVIGLVAELTKK